MAGVRRLSYLGRVNEDTLRGLAKLRGIDLVETLERVQGADGLWRKVARRTVAERNSVRRDSGFANESLHALIGACASLNLACSLKVLWQNTEMMFLDTRFSDG